MSARSEGRRPVSTPPPGADPGDGGGTGGPPAKEPAPVGLRSLGPYLRAYWGTLVVVAMLSLLETLGTLAQPLLTRELLARMDHGDSINRLIIGLLVILLGVAVVGGFRDYLLQRTAEGMVLTARRRLVGRLLRLPIAEFDQRRTGDLLSRVGADTTLLRAVVTSGIFEAATSVVLVIGSAVAMLLLDPVLFGATALGIAAGVAAVVGLARRVRGASAVVQIRVGEMTSAVERSVSAVRTIRASRAEEREAQAIGGTAKSAYAAGLRIARLQAMISPLTSTTIQAAFLVVLGLGGARVASGAMTVGDLVAFILFLFTLWFPLGRALGAYTRLQSGLAALHRIEEVLVLPQESGTDRTDPVATLTVRERAEPAAAGAEEEPPAIEFSGVSFGYPGGEPVLREVSFTVPRGTRSALVGPSGAGKTTVLSLVERFYDITGGSLRVYGDDVRDIPRSELRRRLGYVEQEAPVLAGTLRDNLALAAPHATEEDMLKVLAGVNLTDVVERGSLGLDATVGEAGVLLSGGERQRLALARTFLSAPSILLLDEATSNLDARNEAAMRSAIDTVSSDRTLLVVAHRLATVVDSDQIIVLEGGRVVAAGSHEELTETSPLYHQLATHQLLVK
ncbi:ABC transporter ATP-binding protein [Streptomyces sp. AC550_RSS872]|uniref:ABC transporter ATP-binding protein n=1 Tax=Streptomyces sp. AC550_RSS872 TaxID=2823689 RepID=UPI001C271799|nr:ABC transporter ATP-binding protein [Streptomyces sp. AC550_RSS872]